MLHQRIDGLRCVTILRHAGYKKRAIYGLPAAATRFWMDTEFRAGRRDLIFKTAHDIELGRAVHDGV